MLNIVLSGRRNVLIVFMLAAVAVAGFAQASNLGSEIVGWHQSYQDPLSLYGIGTGIGNLQYIGAAEGLEIDPMSTAVEDPPAKRRVPTGDLIHAICMMAFSVVTVAYWVDFYTAGNVETSADPTYVDFESSFPLADGYMAAGYMTSAVLLLSQKPLSVPFGIAAGSASIYLGCMDLLYDLRHDKFRNMTPAMAFETTIIATSLTFGAITIIRLWIARHRLGA